MPDHEDLTANAFDDRNINGSSAGIFYGDMYNAFSLAFNIIAALAIEAAVLSPVILLDQVDDYHHNI